MDCRLNLNMSALIRGESVGMRDEQGRGVRDEEREMMNERREVMGEGRDMKGEPTEKCDESASLPSPLVLERLRLLPVQARRLLCVIVRQAYHGTLRSKTPGRATMPEIHEACGLDVDELHELLALLREAGLVSVEGSYPFEEIRLEGQPAQDAQIWEAVLHRCDVANIELESVIVNMEHESLFDRRSDE